MEISKTLYVKDRKAWRKWLSKHYKSKEIWLIYPRKKSGKPRLLYNDAVEVALCFGWIDSIAKRFDDESYVQRFSPRRDKSNWSQPNIERMKHLIKLGEMTPAGLSALKDKSLLTAKSSIAPDILMAIKSDKEVWKNFQAFPDHYKRMRIAYIEDSREVRSEFKKRLNNFLKKTKANKRFGIVHLSS